MNRYFRRYPSRYRYLAGGQLTNIARFKDTDGGATNEVATSLFQYVTLGRVDELRHQRAGVNLFTPHQWSFDAMNRITQYVGSDGTSDYTYDKTNQLLAADHNYQTDESYSYDLGDNRTVSGYVTGDDNQLTSDGVFNYTYDDEGNRLSRTQISTGVKTEYGWGFRNRLTTVTEKTNMGLTTQVVAYTDDAFNRRIGKQVDTTAPFTFTDAAIERYVIDDFHGVASVDGGNVVLDFVDPDGVGSQPMQLSKRYLYGNAVDQLFAQENLTQTISSADRIYWPLTDNLQTVRDLVDNTGTLEEHYEYDSYGEIVSGDVSKTRYLYTGREHDASTGLQYNRARWYDPAVGRWLNQDPIGFAAGDTNIYRYVGNKSTLSVDPSGLEELVSYLPPIPIRGHSVPGGSVVETDDSRLVQQLAEQHRINHFGADDALMDIRQFGYTRINVYQVPHAEELWNDYKRTMIIREVKRNIVLLPITIPFEGV